MSRFGAKSRPSDNAADFFGGNSNLDVQVFTGSGTWVKPAGTKWVRAIVVAGGGGGGIGGRAGSFAADKGIMNGSGYRSYGIDNNSVPFTYDSSFSPAYTANIRLTFRLRMDNIAGRTTLCLNGSGGAALTQNFRFEYNNGTLTFYRASATVDRSFSVSGTAAAQGVPFWLRVTYTANSGGNSQVVFEKAADSVSIPSTWTQIGTTQTAAAVTTAVADTTGLRFFSSSPQFYNLDGLAYRAICEFDVTASGTWTTQVDADFTTLAAGTTSYTFNGKSGTLSQAGQTRGGGGGGGASGYSLIELGGPSIPDTVSVTVGAGGTGATYTDQPILQNVYSSSTNTNGVTTIASVVTDTRTSKLVLSSGSRPGSSASTNVITSVTRTVGGVTQNFVKANSAVSPTNTNSAEIWYLDSPLVGTANVTVTHGSTTINDTTSYIYAYAGTASGVYASGNASGGAGTPSLSVPNLAAVGGAVLIDSGAWNGTGTVTLTSGQVASYNVTTPGNYRRIGSRGNAGYGITSVTLTQSISTGTSGAYAAAVFAPSLTASDGRGVTTVTTAAGTAGSSLFGTYAGTRGATGAGNGGTGGIGSSGSATGNNSDGCQFDSAGLLTALGGTGGSLSSTSGDPVTNPVNYSCRPSFSPFKYIPNPAGGLSSPAANAGSTNNGLAGGLGSGGGGSGGTSYGYSQGVGGTGGGGYVIVSSWTGPCDIQHFTGSGTWTKPVGNYSNVHVICIGGGGGGGSGRRGATGSGFARSGGAGGGGGGWNTSDFVYGSLPSSVSVTVGTGGTAGTNPSTNDTNGNPGGTGGTSSFGSLVQATGGSGGAGGTGGSGVVAAAGGSGGLPLGTGGGTTALTGASPTTNGIAQNSYTYGGAPGASCTSADVNQTGIGTYAQRLFTGITVTAAGASATRVFTGPGLFGGKGGGSSNANNPANSGSGADGGGGAGGAASTNGVTVGNAGNGGNGWVTVVTW